MKNKTLITIFVGFVIVALGVFWMGQKKNPGGMLVEPDGAEKKLVIVATFYPLAEFAQAVGGDAVSVTTIVPAGAEPHDYEPTPRDILAAYRSQVFLLNGSGLDPWAEKIRPDLERNDVTIVQMSERVLLLPISDTGMMTRVDPHFWLDPMRAITEVQAIRDVLIARDPTRSVDFARNAATFVAELQVLDEEYQSGLSHCALHTIVTSHQAFGYLADRYGFEAVSVSGLSPEAEPSPNRMAEVVRLVNQKGVKYIFFESLVSPKVAETLADETGTRTLVFDPIEGLTDTKRAEGKNYLSIMRDNLQSLQTALQCQL